MDSKNIKKEYTDGEITVVWQLGNVFIPEIAQGAILMYFIPKNIHGFNPKTALLKKLKIPLIIAHRVP